MIIGLTGYATSGKDTAAAGLIEDGWERVSFADPLKKMALEINPSVHVEPFGTHFQLPLAELIGRWGWTEAKKDCDVRRFLQNLGCAVRKYFGEDAWVRLACETITSTKKNVVVTDCRFPNEFDLIHSLGGRLVRVDRPGVGPVNGHESESYVADAPADAVLYNHGTPGELKDGLRRIVQQLGFRVLDKAV